ncbi:PP0621 family protein [Paraburkholderia humisilvae]|uniref:Deaminase n=1 Tax=Paraburkholderia humisilvae TaxID=627669 RepID=A0A6J5ED82_9BURK|nr:PP0621 family protein [Paraburkholderia humisilvae]CAB3763584.1 hypothetical protein LMG29542_04639 [Paraburkholderia humisilvae]
MRQIILLILLFVVGQWLVKTLRRPAARSSSRPGGGARSQPGANGANSANSAHGADQSSSNRAGNRAAGGAQRPNGAARAGANRQLPEPMIRCVECGVHAPKSDSVMLGGQPFCSSEHARRYAARAEQAKGREGR